MAVLGGRLACPVLLGAPVEVWEVRLLLQLRWLLGGRHQHRVPLAAVLRVIGVFSLGRDTRDRVRAGKGRLLWGQGLPTGPRQEGQTAAAQGTALADEKGSRGPEPTWSKKTTQELQFFLLHLKEKLSGLGVFSKQGFGADLALGQNLCWLLWPSKRHH